MRQKRGKGSLDHVDDCLNCGAKVRGGFCPVCGQRNDDLQRSIFALGGEIVQDVFAYDSRFYRTLKALFLTPGRLTREFAEGRRARYMPPIRLYLITTLLLFVLLSISDIAIIGFNLSTPSDQEQSTTEERSLVNITGVGRLKSNVWGVRFFERVQTVNEDVFIVEEDDVNVKVGNEEENEKVAGFAKRAMQGLNAIAQDPRAANAIINTWLPRIMILLLPLFAFTLKIFYIFRKERLLNHAVYSLHYHSAIFLFLGFLITLQWAMGGMLPGSTLAQIFLASTALYSLAALKGYYRQGWIKTIFKWLFLGAAYIFLVLISLGLSIWMNMEFQFG